MALKRGYFPAGYEGKIYVSNVDPEEDPQLEVKELDCRLRVIQQGDQEILALYVYRNGEWELFNTWDNIVNKPAFAPSPHDWYGEHHTGDRPLKAKEHTLDNPVHVRLRIEAIMMGQGGAARAGSTMI